MDVYKGLNDTRPQASAGPAEHQSHASIRRDGTRTDFKQDRWGRNADLRGLTTRNMTARFSAMRSVLGVDAYEDILGQHGCRDVTTIPSIDNARQVYKTLLDAFPDSIRGSTADDRASLST